MFVYGKNVLGGTFRRYNLDIRNKRNRQIRVHEVRLPIYCAAPIRSANNRLVNNFVNNGRVNMEKRLYGAPLNAFHYVVLFAGRRISSSLLANYRIL